MRKMACGIVLTAAMAVLAFASVKTDYNHSTDFGKYRTYSWISANAGNSLWADRITSAVDAQLEAKGLSKVPSGGDVRVSAFGSTQNQQSIQTFYDTLGGGWFWGGFGGEATSQVVNTPVGSLTVDLFDGQSKRLVWRGTSTATLSEHPEKNEAKLNKDVEDMFKHFPPSAR